MVGIIQLVVWMVWFSGVAASHLDNSLSATSIIVSLFGGDQAVSQLLAARQRDFQQEPTGVAVAERGIAENRVITGLERTIRPARACQNPRTRNFENPCTCWFTILDVFLDDEGDVRVGPVDGLDGAFHGLGVLEIVGRIRMMGRCDATKTEDEARSKENGSGRRHLDHPHFIQLY